jgi:hypothetical protein
MASGDAWQQGWSLGSQMAGERYRRKTELWDKQYGQLEKNIDSIQTKLGQLGPDHPRYGKTRDALKQAITERNNFLSPAKNPGALERFRERLTDKMGITNPYNRANRAVLRDLARRQTAEGETAALAAAAPLDIGTETGLKTRAAIDAVMEGADRYRQKLRQQNPNMTDEELERRVEEYTEAQFGTAAGRYGKPAIQYGTLGPGGKRTFMQYNPLAQQWEWGDGRAVGEEDWAAWNPDPRSGGPKPPTSKWGMFVAAYRKSHGIPDDQTLPFDVMKYIAQQVTISSEMGSQTIAHTLKQDANGFWVPIEETNQRIPGIGQFIPDPLGMAVPDGAPTRPQGQTAAGAPAGTAPPLAQLRQEAQHRAGAGTPQGARAGAPLFAAPNKDLNETRAAYQAAIDRVNTMDKNLESALRGDQQAMLSLVANHIGMTLGAQKGARINQAVWNEAVESAPFMAKAEARFDGRGLLAGVTLAPDQMRQMVNLAHEKVDTLRDHVLRLEDQLKLPHAAQPENLGDMVWMQDYKPDGTPVPGAKGRVSRNEMRRFMKDHPNAREVRNAPPQ